MKDKTTEDRRMFERVPLKISLRFLDCYSNKWSLVKTRNISVRGIGLVTTNDLAVGTPLEMWLPIPNRGESHYSKGKVAWSREVKPEKYNLGICLDRLDLEGMSHFIKKDRQC